MIKLRKISIKILLVVALVLIISTTINKCYAYQISTKAVPKEELRQDTDDFPDMLYRKQTAAFATTIREYQNRKSSYINKWLYEVNSPIQYIGENVGVNNSSHSNWRSFNRIYEYFHPHQNSVYSSAAESVFAGVAKKKRYYSTGQSWVTDNAEITARGTGSYYRITSETEQYAGMYWKPWDSSLGSVITGIRNDFYNNNIIIFNNNMYRWAIVNGDTIISDNKLVPELIDRIEAKYKDKIKNGTLEIYNSSNNRTSSANGKYYMNMDTAYKFFETTLKGEKKDGWWESTTTVATDPHDSFVNYYDNTIEIPLERKTKRNIYKTY